MLRTSQGLFKQQALLIQILRHVKNLCGRDKPVIINGIERGIHLIDILVLDVIRHADQYDQGGEQQDHFDLLLNDKGPFHFQNDCHQYINLTSFKMITQKEMKSNLLNIEMISKDSYIVEVEDHVVFYKIQIFDKLFT